MRKLFLLLSVACFITACGNDSGNKSANQPVVIDYEALESGDFFSTQTFSSIEPVYLDENGAILGSPLCLKIKNGNYYIYDMQQLHIYTFDSNGKMLNKLARIGRAKGEYTVLKDFDIKDNGNIELLCEFDAKILKYTPNGEFIEEKELGYSAMSFLIMQDGYFISKDWFANTITQDNTVLRTDANLNILEGMLPKNDCIFANWANMSFSQSGSENPPLYKHVYDRNIYRIVADTLQLAYEISFGKKAYTDEYLNYKSYEEALNFFMHNTGASVGAAFENEDFLALNINEDGVEESLGYLLYDKATQKIIFQKFSNKDDIANCLGRPVALTPQNELVFIAEPEMLKELSAKNKLFSSLNISKLQEGSGYVILKMQIR